MLVPLLRWLVLMVCPLAFAQVDNGTAASGSAITLTGILLVNDLRCDERRMKHELPEDRLKQICPDGFTQWGLASGKTIYSVYGNTAELMKYGRTRVTVTGTLSEEVTSIVTKKRIAVQSIAPAEITDAEVRKLIEQLRNQRLPKPEHRMSPGNFMIDFTPSMVQLLQAGPAAQSVLLEYLNDEQIKDQIVVLLGGVGDENVIEPIIQAMAEATDHSERAKTLNLEASLALTNITQAEVIWHHGGGILYDRCPYDPKSCWYAWWFDNRETFKVSTETEDRRYSNYPNYGIYQQP